MLEKLIGPTHTFKEGLLVLEKGLRSGEITLYEAEPESAAGQVELQPVANGLIVENLPYSFTADDLRKIFAAFGKVRSAQIAVDRESGRSRGFGFVEMASPQQAQAAVQGLNEKEIGGRTLAVKQSRPRASAGHPS